MRGGRKREEEGSGRREVVPGERKGDIEGEGGVYALGPCQREGKQANEWPEHLLAKSRPRLASLSPIDDIICYTKA